MNKKEDNFFKDGGLAHKYVDKCIDLASKEITDKAKVQFILESAFIKNMAMIALTKGCKHRAEEYLNLAIAELMEGLVNTKREVLALYGDKKELSAMDIVNLASIVNVASVDMHDYLKDQFEKIEEKLEELNETKLD